MNLHSQLGLPTTPRTQDWLQVSTLARRYWFEPWIEIPGIKLDIFLKVMGDFEEQTPRKLPTCGHYREAHGLLNQG